MGDSKIVVMDSTSEIVVTESSFGVLVEENPFVVSLGTSGPQGPSGAFNPENVSFVHTQSVSASTWTIVHGLQFIPNMTVVDSAGTVVEGDYSYPDENTIVATFVGGFTGKAYLS